jgi:hypothetical protein
MGGAEMGPSSTIHHTYQRRMRVKASQPGMPAGIAHAFLDAIDQRNQRYEQPCTFESALTQLQQRRLLDRKPYRPPSLQLVQSPIPMLRWPFSLSYR